MKKLLSSFFLSLFLFLTIFPDKSLAFSCYFSSGGSCQPFEYSATPSCPTTTTTSESGEVPAYSTLDDCNASIGGSTSGTSANSAYTLKPKFEDIDDAVHTVDITFNNVEPAVGGNDSNIYVCLESDLCIDNDKIREGVANGDDEALSKSLRMSLDDVDEGTLMRYRLQDGKITVCGDGTSQLKADGDDSNHKYYKGRNGGDEGDWWGKMKKQKRAGCENDRDYFHPGKIYMAALYTKADLDGKEGWTLGTIAGFYVNHHFPQITVLPTTNIQPGSVFNITLATDPKNIVPNGTNKDTSDRNNYQVQVQGSGISARACGFLSKDKPSKSFTLPKGDAKLQPGQVKVTISEQVNERPEVKEALGRALDFPDNFDEVKSKVLAMGGAYIDPEESYGIIACQGGFVYRVYNCTVSKDEKINSCKAYKDPTDPKGTKFEYWQDDPNKVDVRGLLKYLDKLGANSALSEFPCNVGSTTVKDPSKCKSFTTALGTFPVDPIGFVSKLFSVVLSLAGLGAIITIVYSGWRILLSRGDKEKLQAARDRLTSAIVGLLFIIFSLALLSVIGGDILKIPGFG